MGEAQTILSKEEALALPPEKRPLNYRLPGGMYNAVWEAVAEASGCHQESDALTKVAVDLCLKLAAVLEQQGWYLHPPTHHISVGMTRHQYATYQRDGRTYYTDHRGKETDVTDINPGTTITFDEITPLS